MLVGNLNPNRVNTPGLRVVPPPASGNTVIQPTHAQVVAAKTAKDAKDKAEKDAKTAKDKAEKDAKTAQTRDDRLKRDADKKEITLARITAAGTPQKVLNSLLTGVETLQRFAAGGAGVTDPAVIGAPTGTPDAPGKTAPRLFKLVGLPIIIGLAVTALWYFLKPKN